MKTERVIIADNQELTAIAVRTLVEQALAAAEDVPNSNVTICSAGCKAELIREFQKGEATAVVVDYPLFDFSTRENFTMLCECYANVTWLILSEELTDDFLRHVLYSTHNVGVVYKDEHESEIADAIRRTMDGKRYISQHATQQLLESKQEVTQEKDTLTATEREVLRMIALGKTTKAIAAERRCSIHTINAHRRNIFSKIGVNCAYSAMRYAFRAGIVDDVLPASAAI